MKSTTKRDLKCTKGTSDNLLWPGVEKNNLVCCALCSLYSSSLRRLSICMLLLTIGPVKAAVVHLKADVV